MSAERSTNFEFLRTLYPYLAEYGADAEALLDDHPDSSGVRLRRFVEAVVAHIFSKELSSSALPNDLYEQIRVPAFRRVVGNAAVLDDMDAIRRGIGKKGAHHGYDVEKPDVLEGLRAAHRIGQWLVRRSDPAATIDAFVRPNPGGHRAEKAADLKLRARIAKEDLNRVLAELSVLAPPGLEHPSPSELAEAKELIASYQRSLALQLQERTKAFVAMPRDSAPLITLNSAKRIALVGPSGVGKSWRVRRNAIALAAEATVILAEAKYFNGDLNKWLDSAVAAHCFRGAGYLLRISGHLRIPVVIVIDGFDEAPEAHREQLRETTRALETRLSAVVVVIARQPTQLPVGWSESIVTSAPWTFDEIRDLAAQVCPAPIPVAMLRTLRSPFEVESAARAITQLNKAELGAFELIGMHIRQSFTLPSAQIEGLTLGRHLEKLMREELRSALPEARVVRELGEYAERRGIPVSTFTEFLRAHFIEVAQGFVSFAHPNFKAFFHADAVLSSDPSQGQLLSFAKEDASAAQLLLSGPVKDADARSLLAGIGIQSGWAEGGPYRADAIADALTGTLGERIRTLVEQDVAGVWATELERIRGMTVADGEAPLSPPERFSFSLTCEQQLSIYESILFSHLAIRAFEPSLRSNAAGLLDATMAAATRAAEARFGPAILQKRPRALRDYLVWNLFTLRMVETGAGILCRVISGGLSHVQIADAEVGGLLSDLSEGGVGAFYWLILILKQVVTPSPSLAELLPSVLERARESAVSQVSVAALDLAHRIGGDGSPDQMERVRATIQRFPTGNMWVGTLVAEALQAAGERFDFSTEDIKRRLEAVLEHPEDPIHRDAAYGLYSAQLEELGGEAHCAVIETLHGGRRARFLAMAALGPEMTSFWIGSLLQDLIKCDEARAEPLAAEAFRRWAVVLDLNDSFLSDALATSIIANVGLAALALGPAKPQGPVTAGDEVMFLVSELIFLAAQDGPEKRSVAIWERLRSLVEIAAEVVCFDARNLLGVHSTARRLPSIQEDYPDELRELLHLALKRRDSLARRLRPWSPEQRVVEVLGEVGNAASRELLLPLKNDPRLGESVRRTIQSIDEPGPRSRMVIAP